MLTTSLDAATGQILFGGIDTAKYSGTLSSIEIYPDSESRTTRSPHSPLLLLLFRCPAALARTTLTPSNYAVAAILDSGTSLTLLPDDLAYIIFEELGATDDRTLVPSFLVPLAMRLEV